MQAVVRAPQNAARLSLLGSIQGQPGGGPLRRARQPSHLCSRVMPVQGPNLLAKSNCRNICSSASTSSAGGSAGGGRGAFGGGARGAGAGPQGCIADHATHRPSRRGLAAARAPPPCAERTAGLPTAAAASPAWARRPCRVPVCAGATGTTDWPWRVTGTREMLCGNDVAGAAGSRWLLSGAGSILGQQLLSRGQSRRAPIPRTRAILAIRLDLIPARRQRCRCRAR
jgi:hypothetical protein